MRNKLLEKNPHYFYFFFLFLLAIFVFSPQMGGSFIWDDLYSFSTKQIYEFKRDPFQYTWTLTNFTYVIMHELFTENFFMYKSASLLLHLTNGILVFKILKLLRVNPYFISAVFLLHPVQAMSVSWISQIKTLEMSFFVLLSCYFLLKYQNDMKKSSLYSLPFFMLANLFKWSYVALPAPYLAEKLYFLKNKKLRFFIFTLLVTIGLGITFFIISREFIITYTSYVGERYYQRVQEFIPFSIPNTFNFIITKIYFFFSSLGHYALKALFPFHLSPLYEANKIYIWRFFIGLCFIFALVPYFFKKKKLSELRALALSIASLLPVLGIIWAPFMHFTPFSDQHAYLFIPIFYYIVQKSLFPLLSTIKTKVLISLIIISILSIKTYLYNYSFKSNKSFFQKVTEQAPNNFIAHLNLSTIYAREKSYVLAKEEAIKAYKLLDQASPRENNFLHDQFRSLTPYILIEYKYLDFPLKDARLKGVDL